MFSACPVARLLRDAAELRQRRIVARRDVREIAECVHAREALHRQIRLHVDAPAPALRHSRPAADRSGHEAAAPDGEVRLDRRPVAQHDVIGRDLFRGHAEPELHSAPLELLRRVRVGVLGERPEHGVAEVDEDHPGPDGGEVVVDVGHDVVCELRERAGRLDACRTAADDHEGQRTLVDQIGVGARVLEQLQHARANPFGVVQRVERERELVGALGVEEIRLRARGEDDAVGFELAVVGEREPV